MARVLVADDEVALAKILAFNLRKLPGVERVDEVANAVDLIAKANSGTYSAIFTDNDMPGGTGIETIRSLRKRFSKDELPIALMSARDVQQEALSAGANHFVSKPYSFEGDVLPIAKQYLRIE